MKVLFDHQIFNYVYGGASKYFVMLLNSLPKELWSTSTLFSSNEYVKDTKLMRYIPKMFKGQTVLMEWLNRPYTRSLLNRGNYDLFHQTNFGTYCLNDIGKKPMVTTFHDSNLLTIDPHPHIVEQQRRSLNRANAIVCVSENTKRDLLLNFDVDEDKIHVIYHGIVVPNIDALPKTSIVNSPYILYVGRRSKYKNFTRLVKVFSRLKLEYVDMKLVCTAEPFSNEENAMFEQLHITNSIIHIAATEQMMNILYRDALFLVFPSLYEGFGMPILEAWSCNCAVALSDTSCFPEIADTAGLYFDPHSDDDMYIKLKQLIDDKALRLELIKRGRCRLKMFSWERCAQEHYKLYKSLL